MAACNKDPRRRRWVLAVAAMALAVGSGAQAANSDVCASSACIANGESACDRGTADCPPCMYLLSTGSFSCYDLVDGVCPYGGAYTICNSSSSSSSGSTAAPSSATAAPSSATAAPNHTTASSPSSDTSSSINSIDNSVEDTDAPIVNTSASSPSSSESSSSSSGSSSSSNLRSGSSGSSSPASVTPTPSSPSAPSSGSESTAESSATTSADENDSSDVTTMAALIGAAAFGTIVIIVFVARRVRKRRALARKLSQSSFDADGAVFSMPPDVGKRPGMAFASRAYSSHLTPTVTNSITVLGGGGESLDGSVVMLADSRTQATARPSSAAGATLLSMSSLSSSTADLSLGPQFRADMSAVVDLAASSASTASLKTHPASPMTLDASLTLKPVAGHASRVARTNLVPNAIVEGREDEDEFSSFEQQSRYVRLASAESVIYSKLDFSPESSGVSITSTMSSLTEEYDIVDPHTIREGERRDTELLVRDSEFPKFSAFSQSDLLSEDGDEDEDSDEKKDSDEDPRGLKEHEI